jgi:hypothetical protein
LLFVPRQRRRELAAGVGAVLERHRGILGVILGTLCLARYFGRSSRRCAVHCINT